MRLDAVTVTAYPGGVDKRSKLTIRLLPDTRTRLLQLALAEHRSLNSMVTTLIEAEWHNRVKEHGNDQGHQ